VGTKLAGVGAIWGALCVGRRLVTSTCAARADVMGPWPKWFSGTTTTAFCTVLLR